MIIEFDPIKDADNQRRRGLPFSFAADLFLGDYLEREIIRPGLSERRFLALGQIPAIDDKLYVVVYPWRGDVCRIISFRRANDREARQYRSPHR